MGIQKGKKRLGVELRTSYVPADEEAVARIHEALVRLALAHIRAATVAPATPDLPVLRGPSRSKKAA